MPPGPPRICLGGVWAAPLGVSSSLRKPTDTSAFSNPVISSSCCNFTWARYFKQTLIMNGTGCVASASYSSERFPPKIWCFDESAPMASDGRYYKNSQSTSFCSYQVVHSWHDPQRVGGKGKHTLRTKNVSTTRQSKIKSNLRKKEQCCLSWLHKSSNAKKEIKETKELVRRGTQQRKHTPLSHSNTHPYTHSHNTRTHTRTQPNCR